MATQNSCTTPPKHLLTHCGQLTGHVFTVCVHPVEAPGTLDHLAFKIIVRVGLAADRTEVALALELVAVSTACE